MQEGDRVTYRDPNFWSPTPYTGVIVELLSEHWCTVRWGSSEKPVREYRPNLKPWEE